MTDDSLIHQDRCYSQALLQGLNSLRQTGVLCDVVLQVENDTINAHRLVLAAFSVYFKAMFAGHLAERTHDTVVLHDIHPEALKAVIDYAYTSEIKVDETNVQTIMSCASMFQITSIMSACSDFLSSHLHPINCLGIKQYATLYSCLDLETQAKLYTRGHFSKVVGNDEFLSLPRTELAWLLSEDHLDVESEECVFSAIVSWVKFDPASRLAFLVDLLWHVRFNLLPKDFIQRMADREPVLSDFAAKFKTRCSSLGNVWKLPNSKTLARFSETKKVIFALGGENAGYPLTSTQCYIPEYNCWQDFLPSVDQDGRTGWQEAISCMPTARTNFGAIADTQNIYVAGGTTSVQALDTVEVYSSINNSWNSLPPMTRCRNGCKAALLNGALFVFGGHDGFEYLSSVEAYRLEGNLWESYAEMKFPLGFCGFGVMGGMLYVLGGTGRNANEGDIYYSEMERYDPGQNQWTTMAPMKGARAYFSSVVLDGCLYAIGGFNRRWLNTVEKYDPQTNKWHYVSALSLPRSSFTATVHRGCIFVAGGFTGKKNVNTVEKYDPCTNKWNSVCAMPMCRYGLQLVAMEVPCRKYNNI